MDAVRVITLKFLSKTAFNPFHTILISGLSIWAISSLH